MEDGRGWMARLAPVRDELLRGDLRSLYIGWLAAVAGEMMDDDETEPLCVSGLGDLTAAQQALAEFLEVDPDLLAGADMGSPAAQEMEVSRREIKRREKRKAYLKNLSSDFPKAWVSVKEPVERGSGRGYDEACRLLVDIAEAYALYATKKQFRKELEKVMAGHLRRRALIQRLVKAGIWKEE